ncbi:hypothetical protein CEXT_221251 [Caerostris extrusa]|uniref:Uncharacterized protein n=1 Tax=Caerostris extrusa TaxID=172846 RepID=A0AAV4QGN1_CAEEX|nr:hypothetical protein CEXT_221251 [Caerostris extrusa]
MFTLACLSCSDCPHAKLAASSSPQTAFTTAFRYLLDGLLFPFFGTSWIISAFTLDWGCLSLHSSHSGASVCGDTGMGDAGFLKGMVMMMMVMSEGQCNRQNYVAVYEDMNGRCWFFERDGDDDDGRKDSVSVKIMLLFREDMLLFKRKKGVMLHALCY